MKEEIYMDDESCQIQEHPKEIFTHKRVIELRPDDIVPIVISNQKTPEMVLGRRFDSENGKIQYLVKFVELPIENSEWLSREKIKNAKIIMNFEKKQSKCDKE